ncbi:TetR/AcrR family transcriptional regulator [Paenibacillus campi]|uniref:TetR/AcrR family transcriptional regulator n=1 Tax=Paenibacillus campi TaxID=3106031 RepID=UPI002AFDD22E|nr:MULTISPECIES: TetR/AcrR family transcriptional regulator [unclassified Paenibacillus]
MNVKQQLLVIGLSHFACDGYEGASLARIAAEAGIKKPSIYAHFNSKADLFLRVLHRAARLQRHSIRRYMLQHHNKPLEYKLHGLLEHMQQLYHSDDTIKFVMRMSFFPPKELEAQVLPFIYHMLDTFEQQLVRLLEHDLRSERRTITVSAVQAARAYMTCADGILLEMLYGQEQRSVQRLDATWPIYWTGLTGKE